MRRINLGGKYGVGRYALVDDKDFDWLNQWHWFAVKGRNTYYAERKYTQNGVTKRIKMHRLIMNASKGIDIDHQDGNGLNNQRENLRFATNSQNQYNKCLQSNNTSGYKGVSYSKRYDGWGSYISFEKKCIWLGYYATAIGAGIAYNHAAKKYFGKFALFNDIPGWENINPMKDVAITHKNNTSGFRGVSFNKKSKKWVVAMRLKGEDIFIGCFTDKITAAKAYDTRAKELLGDKAKLNF